MGLMGFFETLLFWYIVVQVYGYLTDDGVKEPPIEWGMEPKGSIKCNAYEAYHNKPGLFSRFLLMLSNQPPMPSYEYKLIQRETKHIAYVSPPSYHEKSGFYG